MRWRPTPSWSSIATTAPASATWTVRRRSPRSIPRRSTSTRECSTRSRISTGRGGAPTSRGSRWTTTPTPRPRPTSRCCKRMGARPEAALRSASATCTSACSRPCSRRSASTPTRTSRPAPSPSRRRSSTPPRSGWSSTPSCRSAVASRSPPGPAWSAPWPTSSAASRRCSSASARAT